MTKKQSIRRLLFLPTLALGALLLAACGEGDAASPDDSAPPANGGEAQEIRVLMHDDYFEPTEITVQAGEPVTFIAENVGVAMHNMVIQSEAGEGQTFMSDALVNPGDESAFEATFTQTGTYEYQCTLHLPGMVGTLTVE